MLYWSGFHLVEGTKPSWLRNKNNYEGYFCLFVDRVFSREMYFSMVISESKLTLANVVATRLEFINE